MKAHLDLFGEVYEEILVVSFGPAYVVEAAGCDDDWPTPVREPFLRSQSVDVHSLSLKALASHAKCSHQASDRVLSVGLSGAPAIAAAQAQAAGGRTHGVGVSLLVAHEATLDHGSAGGSLTKGDLGDNVGLVYDVSAAGANHNTIHVFRCRTRTAGLALRLLARRERAHGSSLPGIFERGQALPRRTRAWYGAHGGE